MGQKVLAVDGKAVTVNGQALSADGIVDAVITDHIADTTVHVTEQNKTAWNDAATKAAGAVRYDTTQSLTEAQKIQARSNIGAGSPVTVDAALSATSENPVQNKVVKAALDGKAASGHGHDDRYYTESEIDTKLNGKANSQHSHSASDIASGILQVARGGTGVETLDALKTALGVGAGAKIQTGSYTGTGTYGSSNPCSLTFDFVPKFVTIRTDEMPTGYAFTEMTLVHGVAKTVASKWRYVYTDNASLTIGDGSASESVENNVTWGDTHVEFYALSSTASGTRDWFQMNATGKTYHYIAIG